MDRLYRFLNQQIGRPFVWGENDCCLILADWIREVYGYDPAEHLRFTYDSASSCQRHTRFFTNPVSVVASMAEDVCNFSRTDSFVKGDVGILYLPVDKKMTPVGGIFTGKSWAVKAPDGVTTLQPHEIKAVWGVGYGA